MWQTEQAHTIHTHTHLTALFPRLPGWAGTRKVKPIWILLKQETVSGSGISWAICKCAPRCRQKTMPAPHNSVFYRLDALPAAQPTASKHWRLTSYRPAIFMFKLTMCSGCPRQKGREASVTCHSVTASTKFNVFITQIFPTITVNLWPTIWSFEPDLDMTLNHHVEISRLKAISYESYDIQRGHIHGKKARLLKWSVRLL